MMGGSCACSSCASTLRAASKPRIRWWWWARRSATGWITEAWPRSRSGRDGSRTSSLARTGLSTRASAVPRSTAVAGAPRLRSADPASLNRPTPPPSARPATPAGPTAYDLGRVPVSRGPAGRLGLDHRRLELADVRLALSRACEAVARSSETPVLRRVPMPMFTPSRSRAPRPRCCGTRRHRAHPEFRTSRA